MTYSPITDGPAAASISSPSPAAAPPPDTGDAVRVPSIDEEWLVAFVEGGRLYCLGWPLSSVPVSECVVIERATHERRFDLLLDMAASQCSSRSNYARNRLARGWLAAEGER